jgi:DNA primase
MRIAKAVLQTIGQSPNAVQRAKLIQEAAELLNLPASALQDELRRITAKHSAPVRASAEETAASAAIPQHPQDEVELCEHMIHVVDFPEMREVVEQCLPLDMVTDPVCRTVVKAALDSTAEGEDFQRTLNHEQDPSGELQRFAAQIQMAPNKSTGRETARVDAVKGLILCLWRKKLQQERGTLGPDQAERAHQITLDLQALKHWADGSAIIKIRLAG